MRYGIRAARVVDIASDVAALSAVNGASVFKLKQVFAPYPLALLAGNDSADVFNDSSVGSDRLLCK